MAFSPFSRRLIGSRLQFHRIGYQQVCAAYLSEMRALLAVLNEEMAALK